MSNANILVIGNGFDLYHGLKTNYIDFVRFSKELSKTDKGTKGRKWVISNSFIRCFINVVSENQNWIDCEKEIEIIVTMFLKIMHDRNVFDNIPYCIEKDNTSLESYEFDRLKLMNRFCEKSNTKKIELRDNYIKKMSNQIEEINPDYVINFNYTNTYEHYGINRKNVCYVHGSVQDNNMVLGIRDIDEKDINSIYFKKFFQRIQKHTDVIQWDRFIEDHGLGSKFNIANTYFFGHSLSNTDGDLIRSIYENSCKINIFHLNIQKDYEQKVINLIDTLGKESVIQGIYSGKIKFIPIK